MGGGSIKKLTQKRSINFTTETLETLDKLAAKNHTTTSELVRGYVEKGLSIEGSREDIDFIARIIRQEITAVYHVDEIKAIADHDTDRLAKMLMKIGKINGAMEINRTQVAPEEVLSDEVYSYDYRQQKLTMATSPIQTKELLDQITGMCDHGDFMEEEQEADLCMGE